MPLSFYVIGKDRKILELDNGGNTSGNTGYMPVVEYEHHQVHEGVHFSCSDYDSVVDTGTPKYWLVRAPATGRVHAIFELIGSKNGLIEVFETPTKSADGTGVTCFNNDRNSSNTPTLLVFKDPTVSVDGTLLSSIVIGSDTTSPQGARGGRNTRGKELILKVSTDYIIKFTSLTNTNRVSLDIEFYEVS